MIRSFGDKGLEKCWRDGFCKSVRPDLVERVRMKLDQIHFVGRLQDLATPDNRLHPLKGDLRGFWAISVNGPWRLIFKHIKLGCHFDEIRLIQYH